MKMRIDAVLYLLLTVVFALPTALQAETKDTPIAVKAERSFPKLRLRRPIVLTHAGDGTNRVFIALQYGSILVMPNDQNVEKPKTFLDIESRVAYKDKENEEGLLGFAFHPNYKKNGQFFLYYTSAKDPHTSIVSRFRVSKTDPNVADPDSEEELMRIKQPFWNHNGGAVAFGPDGKLYIALGDGGSANDPHENGQNLSTLLGSMLRIDVDCKDNGKNYAIPKDNPFVGRKGARPEIWAYGLRNVWGMSFDQQGNHWVGDVGQKIWEEIDLIVRGGNYGWNIREAKHPFGPKGSPTRKDLIEPIWEYHHEISGKSITGGHVYRGKRAPQLTGCFLYADYVSGKIWALDYDLKNKKVRANYVLKAKSMPIISFGQDEMGESYMTDSFGMIYHFTPVKK